ncbi:MAG: hypothetical protein RL708_1858 [Bacteroidota bacterium]|jgi:hypothetical protein
MNNTELEIEKETANTGLKWGGFSAAAYVLITYIMFLIFKDARCVIGPYSYVPYLAMIIFMFMAAIEKRKLMGGYINFKTTVSNTFLVLIMTMISFMIFQYVLYNMMAPQLKESLKYYTIQYVSQFLKQIKYSQEQFDEAIDMYKNSSTDMPISRIFPQTLTSVVFGFFWAAVVALIIRKKQPTI